MNTRSLPPGLQRDRALRLFIEKVRRLPRPPEMIVLYGSRARGDHRPDSDYDLLVVLTEKDGQTIDELYRAVQEVELETIRAISLLIRTREQYEVARSRGERVLRDAEQEGYLLWSQSYGSAFELSGTKEKSD
ncbi:MAG: nucleotidyltransferase domain-containing protein [Firmicutes bacterium]|mgnify:CR=1 FL=1|nr:nucleotidyltransferase domain-containing protein [Bacillota bacterium]